MVIFLFKRPFKARTMTKYLVIFLLIFAGLGAVRFAEKSNSEEFFNDGAIKSFPTMNPFTWYAQKEDLDKITIFEYDSLEGKSNYNMTVPRFNILSSGDGLDKAIGAADQLPQTKNVQMESSCSSC